MLRKVVSSPRNSGSGATHQCSACRRRWWERLKACLFDIMQVIIPETCCHCGTPLQGDERSVCVACMAHLPYTRNAVVVENATERCFAGFLPIKAAASLLYFDSISASRSIIHEIKYRGNESLAFEMGVMLGRELSDAGRFSDVDAVLPVPLHKRRLRRRGYNQSELIAQGVASVLKVNVLSGVVDRVGHTNTQTQLDREQRFENMQGVFAVTNPLALSGLHVLIVDDVITTGATVASCAAAVFAVGGVNISVASLALAVSSH
ncbi:MAG: ComF family protein [Bacteroidales bacterium]|nr:ComF family protein [Candidatus Colimorpha onthohippi]